MYKIMYNIVYFYLISLTSLQTQTLSIDANDLISLSTALVSFSL